MEFAAPEWHAELPSTNTELLRRAVSDRPPVAGTVLAVQRQTAGRGRYERSWISGRDLTFSLLLRPDSAPARTLSLPMAVALGVCDLLQHYGLTAQTKWPNDVLIAGRKICGILSERAADAVVVGVGLNVNMDAAEAAALDKPATSLKLETTVEHRVEEVLEDLLERLPRWIDRWEQDGFEALRQDFSARCYNLGRQVLVAEGRDEPTQGLLTGFGAEGQLLLLRDGRRLEVWAGDLS